MTDQKARDTFQTAAGTARLAAEAGSRLGLVGEKGAPWDEDLGVPRSQSLHCARGSWQLGVGWGAGSLLEDGKGAWQGRALLPPSPPPHTAPRPLQQPGCSPAPAHPGLQPSVSRPRSLQAAGPTGQGCGVAQRPGRPRPTADVLRNSAEGCDRVELQGTGQVAHGSAAHNY